MPPTATSELFENLPVEGFEVECVFCFVCKNTQSLDMSLFC